MRAYGRFQIVTLGLWSLTACVLVLSFVLGIQPAFQAMTMLSGESSLVQMAQMATAAFQISPRVYAVYALLVRALFVTVQLVIAVLLVRKGERGWFIWFLAFYMLVFGATMTQEIVALGLTTFLPISPSAIQTVVNDTGWLLFVSFLYLFPNGRFVPRWTVFALLGWYVSFLIPMSILPVQIGFLLVGVGSQIYRYRRVSTLAERRQTKWVVYGLFLFIAASLALLPAVNREENALAFEAVVGLVLLLPLSIGVAILRGQLWDVDVIIRKTVQYGLVTAVLALVYFGSIILLQSLVVRTSGEESPVALVISTLLIAALVNPLRRRVQEAVDRRFFRRKYNAARTLTRFAETARNEVSPEALTAELLRAVQETMQPETAGVWLRQRMGQRMGSG